LAEGNEVNVLELIHSGLSAGFETLCVQVEKNAVCTCLHLVQWVFGTSSIEIAHVTYTCHVGTEPLQLVTVAVLILLFLSSLRLKMNRHLQFVYCSLQLCEVLHDSHCLLTALERQRWGASRRGLSSEP
jgi:hypothetical protein